MDAQLDASITYISVEPFIGGSFNGYRAVLLFVIFVSTIVTKPVEAIAFIFSNPYSNALFSRSSSETASILNCCNTLKIEAALSKSFSATASNNVKKTDPSCRSLTAVSALIFLIRSPKNSLYVLTLIGILNLYFKRYWDCFI